MMNLCKDCKFWRRGGEMGYLDMMPADREFTDNLPDRLGRIHGITTDQTSKTGLCLQPSVTGNGNSSWFGKPVIECPTDGVLASCDEQRGWLEVGQDFGCIHWQK